MNSTGNTIKLNICYSCINSMPEGSSVCPACGNDNRVRSNPENTLPEGTVLFRKYLVGKMIGRGGFGVTYIGYDLDLQLKVAIKEYFPAGVSIRASGSYDVISDASTSQDHTAFSKGCEAFLDEARMLASVNSPYIVHVRDFFREHGTAYIVMDYVEGITLTKVLQKAGGRIEAERIVSLMLPLIEQLDKLHEKNIIHRDIKPENIMLVKDWFGVHLVLLDFGAARSFVSGNVSKTFTAVVTPGFAPPEQYSQKSRQGAFTDVYGICATMYYAITGTIPPTATERSIDNIRVPSFFEQGVSDSPNVEAALMHGLALKTENRTQTMRELHFVLTSQTEDKRHAQSHRSEDFANGHNPQRRTERASSKRLQVNSKKSKRKNSGKKYALIGILILLMLVFIGRGTYYFLGKSREGGVINDASGSVEITEVVENKDQSSREKLIAQFQTVEQGDYVQFGHYEQDSDLTNGRELIEWQVLERERNRILLISRFVLDAKPYNERYENVTWETCTLRKWLNEQFFTESFNADEQQFIVLSHIDVAANNSFVKVSDLGNETDDRIFLLSFTEINQFLSSDEARQCRATNFAKNHKTYESDDGFCLWWLRTVGFNPARAVCVMPDGVAGQQGEPVSRDWTGVRPAVWVDMTAIQ